MIERLVIVLALAALVSVAVYAIRAWNRRRLARINASLPAWGTLGVEHDGRPTLIAFSTPSCAACHKAQAPAIDLARQRVGDAVRVIGIDAASQPDVASAFGILTVPSTVVIGQSGQVVAVNQGFAPSGKLVEQLQRA